MRNRHMQIKALTSCIMAFLATSSAAEVTSYIATDLRTLEAGYSSNAIRINGSGQVIGGSFSPDSITARAFLWTPTTPNGTSGTMTDLGTLGGTSSYVTDINAFGQVIGYSQTTG